jgi:hypothetical protein
MSSCPDHAVLAAEQRLDERSRQLGLADAPRPSAGPVQFPPHAEILLASGPLTDDHLPRTRPPGSASSPACDLFAMRQ